MKPLYPVTVALTAALVFIRCATGPLGVTEIVINLKPSTAAENPFPNGYLDWMDHGGGFTMVTLIAKNIPALAPPAKYVVWRFSDTLPLPQTVGTLTVNPMTGGAAGFLNSYPEWSAGDVILVTQEDTAAVTYPGLDTLALGVYQRTPVIPLRFPGFEEAFPWKAALAKGSVRIDPVEGMIDFHAEGLPKLSRGFVYSAWAASEEGFALGDLTPDEAGSVERRWDGAVVEGLAEELTHLSLFKVFIRPVLGFTDTVSSLSLLTGMTGEMEETAPSDTSPGGGHVH